MSKKRTTLQGGEPQAAWQEPSLSAALRAIAAEPVAIGLAIVIFFRPWRDGITYPSFNHYFLFVVLLVAALWGVRLLTRGGRLYNLWPTLLLAGFLVVAALTAFDTAQMDATYRALLYWTTYFFIFLLCVNALRTRLAIGIVLGAFLVTALANASWAIIHYNYVLPMMRRMVEENPALLQQLGLPDLSQAPELRHRIESNRAFGTFLFPNALAAFLVLLIPYVLGEFVPSIAKLRAALRDNANASSSQQRLYTSAAVGLALWFVSATLAWFLFPYLLLIARNDPNWTAHTTAAVFYMGLLPLAIGVTALVIVRLSGLHVLRLTLQCLLLAGIVIVAPIALWLTVSRGGMLALGAALVWCAFLLLLSRSTRRPAWLRPAAAAIILAATLLPQLSNAQQSDNATPSASAPTEIVPVNAPPPGVDPVNVQGRDVVLSDIADTATFRLRLTYWKVGMAMFLDNAITGVGLGNFGTVYANYQYLEAGDTQTAHNDYLQYFAETGIFGGLLFCAFCAWFIIWGALRILREGDTTARFALTGMYGGVVAFLAHSFVDFNFVNPSLAIPAFLMAGLFVARASIQDETSDAPSRIRAKLAAIPILLVVALVMGMGVRVWLHDVAITEAPTLVQGLLNPGNRIVLRNRHNVFLDFLNEMPKAEPGKPIVRPLTHIGLLIPDPARIQTFGVIRVPVRGDTAKLRALEPGEVPPPESLVFVTDINKAREQAVDMITIWAEDLVMTDSLYPYVPETAATLYEWNDHIQAIVTDRDKREQFVLEAEKWALEGVERSPRQAWYRVYYGKALLMRGAIELGMPGVNFYRRAIEQYELARDLYPISATMWRQCALAQYKVGKALIGGGLEEEGAKLIRESEKAFARAQDLDKVRPQG